MWKCRWGAPELPVLPTPPRSVSSGSPVGVVKTNVSGGSAQGLNGLAHGADLGLQRDRALAVLRLRRVVLATVRETRPGQRARAEIGRRPTAGRPPAGAEPGVEERVDQRMA